MVDSTHFSLITPIFNGLKLPKDGYITGYAAIIYKLQLPVPFPKPIAIVSAKAKRSENNEFSILPNSNQVKDHIQLSEIEALYKHLVFSLKYEGIRGLLCSKL